jgi:acetyl-CoA C-acetyltransferase
MIGWSHSRFGKLHDRDLESLIVEVTRNALAHAGVEPGDIDEIFVGHFNGGLWPETFPSSLVHQASDLFRFKPTTRVENACATGTAAIYQGIRAIAAGAARHVLVVGAEKMTHNGGADIARSLGSGAYLKEESDIPYGAAGAFARIAERYFERFGNQSDALARIAAKNHRNGSRNPYAHFQKDVGYEFCRNVSDRNPVVAAPLRRTDCSAVSDGAAAVVLAETRIAAKAARAVSFRATKQVNDLKPMSRRDMTVFEGCAHAWRGALEEARIDLDDLDFVESHDCFTIAELMQYEAMGLTEVGKGATAILEGWTEPEGRLPVNLSGGLKSKGHPIGATGVSMHVMAAMQLSDSAGDMQHRDANLGGVFNMGGYGVANYVSILECTRR